MSSLMERMKKGRGQTAKVLEQALSKGSGGYQKDERIWKYGWVKHATKKDPKSGAPIVYSDSVIRFLPVPFVDMVKMDNGELPEEAVLSPIVHLMRHDFKGKDGQKYQELCLRTIGKDCPVNEHDRPFWEAWKEAGKPDNDMKKILVGRLPSSDYYANILVINDAANPENNGKVFLFKFGNAIKKMIDEAFDPSLPTASPFDPFDPFEGRDLHLTFVGEERSFNNWTGMVPKDMGAQSKWEESQLCGGDEAAIETVMNAAYSLQDFLKPSQFKTYEELKERLLKVLGVQTVDDQNVVPDTGSSVSQSSASSAPVQQGNGGNQPEQAPKQSESQPSQDGVSDDDLDEFERMLSQNL